MGSVSVLNDSKEPKVDLWQRLINYDQDQDNVVFEEDYEQVL